jgi:hypothetical protein
MDESVKSDGGMLRKPRTRNTGLQRRNSCQIPPSLSSLPHTTHTSHESAFPKRIRIPAAHTIWLSICAYGTTLEGRQECSWSATMRRGGKIVGVTCRLALNKVGGDSICQSSEQDIEVFKERVEGRKAYLDCFPRIWRSS